MADDTALHCSKCLMGLFGTQCEIATTTPQPLCSACVEWEANPYDVGSFPTELRQILVSTEKDEPKYLFAYSGGLDSTAALKLLVAEYGIRPYLVHIDNGFRTDQVWRNIMAIRDYFQLDMEVLDRRVIELVKLEYPPGTLFCGVACSERWFLPALREVCARHGFDYCLTGNEAVRQNSVLRPSYPPLVSVLVAHPMSREERREYVADLPWEDPAIYGYDSDCVYAGWALAEYYTAYGNWPEFLIRYLSRRIRLGLADRARELEKLQGGPRISKEQYELVRELLGIEDKRLKRL